MARRLKKLLHLIKQPRFSDTCFAGNHDNLAALFLPDLFPALDQPLNLAIPTVKLGQPRPSRKSAPEGARLTYFPYLNRIRKPLQTMVAKIGKLDRSTGGLEGRCIRKDCVRLGQRLKRSEEHTSELQSLMRISYAVFCLKKKKHINNYII